MLLAVSIGVIAVGFKIKKIEGGIERLKTRAAIFEPSVRTKLLFSPSFQIQSSRFGTWELGLRVCGQRFARPQACCVSSCASLDHCEATCLFKMYSFDFHPFLKCTCILSAVMLFVEKFSVQASGLCCPGLWQWFLQFSLDCTMSGLQLQPLLEKGTCKLERRNGSPLAIQLLTCKPYFLRLWIAQGSCLRDSSKTKS